jgi:UDP-N-acetylmuramoylalanine-D-glutamate ligase
LIAPAFLDPLLACATLFVESNHVLGQARQVGYGEAAARNAEASPAKELVVLLWPACASFD